MYDDLVKDLRYLAKVYSVCENENTQRSFLMGLYLEKYQNCENCLNSTGCPLDKTEPCAFWREITCPQCGGFLLQKQTLNGKPYRRCSRCNFMIGVEND